MTGRALRVGMVDLDTTHPGKWVPLIRSLGHDVVAVFDSGAVHPRGYADSFAREHGVGKVFDSVDPMVDNVDVAFVHSCNWDLHVERAAPFINAGKAVFIDKPMAGRASDLLQLLEWERQGARLTGGSALRYCPEVREWRAGHDPSEVVYAWTGCAVDEFNYGIHAYSLLHGLLGPGVESARHLGSTAQAQMELTWADGRRGMVSVGGMTGYLPFYATIATESDVSHITVDSTRLYRSMLEAVLPYLAGAAPAPAPLADLIEPELAAIAGRLSERTGGGAVALGDIPPEDPGYDGTAFEATYRAKVRG